jgi:tRNA G10  N-methylase Trm11
MDIISPRSPCASCTIVASTRKGDLVFDPFCGSGTSGVASKELGQYRYPAGSDLR